MSYNPINWQNGKIGGTKANATNLNIMDKGIADAHEMLADHDKKIDDFANQQIPEEYVMSAVDNYIAENEAGLALKTETEALDVKIDEVNSQLSSEIVDVENSLGELAEVRVSHNLINPSLVVRQSRPKSTIGSAPNEYDGGNYNSSAFVSFPFKESGYQVNLTFRFENGVPDYVRLFLYKNGGYNSAISISAFTNIDEKTYTYSLTISEENYNGFVLVVNNAYELSNVCICESEYWNGKFQVYGDNGNKINDLIIADSIADVEKIGGIEHLIEYVKSIPLRGKSIVWFGDSLTDQINKGWSVKIPLRNGMISTNYAKSGSTVSYRQRETETTTADNCISKAIETYVNDCVGKDYVIVSGGINDAFGGSVYSLGALSDDYQGEISTVEDTVLGALENAIRLLLKKCLGSKIGYVLTYRMPTALNQDSVFNGIKSVCEKYGIPVLDLRYCSGICAGIDEVNSLYFSNGDRTHLTEEGYEKYVNDKVEAWLKTL